MNSRIPTLITCLALAGICHAGAKKSTINQLLKSGSSVECSFTAHELGQQKGTFYISGKNIRGDFTLTDKSAQSTVAHTLQKDDWVYMWGGAGGEKQGTKFKVSEAQKTKKTRPQPGLDLDQEVELDCKAWTPKADTFVPPAGVAFQDITASLKSKSPAGTAAPMSGSSCSACDQAPPQSQGQCRQALSCP